MDTPSQDTANAKADNKSSLYHGHRQRLRTRVLTGDGSGLADYELLELVLCAFIPRRDVKPIAKAMVKRFGSVAAALASNPVRLQEIDGIGETAAAYIRALHLLHVSVAREEIEQKPILSSWAALLNYLKQGMSYETVEQFRVLFLDKRNRLVADEVLGRGTLDHAPVYPRELAKRSLELSAAAVILAHNHPSGDPTPSRADLDITRQIIDVLTPLEVKVHDHLVIGKGKTVSLKAQGLI